MAVSAQDASGSTIAKKQPRSSLSPSIRQRGEEKPKRPRSPAEELFASHARLAGLDLQREYRFAADLGRKYRADFASPRHRLLIEIEGGSWVSGRHNRGSGFEADARKYNLACELGFRLLRFTPAQVKSGEALATVQRVLGLAA